MMIDLLVALGAAAAFGGSYYRLLRGTGLLIGGLLEVLVGLAVLSLPQAGNFLAGGLILGAAISELVYQQRRKAYPGAVLVYEGGGIRRGLTPVEVGTFWDIPETDKLALGMIELLQKGFVTPLRGDQVGFKLTDSIEVSGEIVNPKAKRLARKAAARKESQILNETEDILLELLRQHNGQPISSLTVDVWAEQLKNQVEFAMGGFDPEKTCEYYDDFITHRLNGVAAGHFTPDDYTGWMALAWVNEVIPAESLRAVIQKNRPAWLLPGESYDIWLERLLASVRG